MHGPGAGTSRTAARNYVATAYGANQIIHSLEHRAGSPLLNSHHRCAPCTRFAVQQMVDVKRLAILHQQRK